MMPQLLTRSPELLDALASSCALPLCLVSLALVMRLLTLDSNGSEN